MTKKNANQKIRFNYFVPYLINQESLEENIRWNMGEFSEFFIDKEKSQGISTAVPLGDEIADLERETVHIDTSHDGDIYYFQLSKNRSKNIPSKKKLNHKKTPIELDEDEYIGEFNLLVFDSKYNILIVQSNLFGLSTKQIQTTLSILRQRIKEAKGESEKDNPRGVVLRPLIDNSEIENVKNNDIYRRISIKGSDYNLASSDKYKDHPINRAIKELSMVGGVNFNIELSMSRTSRDKSLDKSQVRDAIDQVLVANNENRDISMNIASKKEEEDSIDVINLLEPRLTSTIKMNVKNRTTISSESMYQNFCEDNYIKNGNETNFRTKASRISGYEIES